MAKLFAGKTPLTDPLKEIDNSTLPSSILTILSEGGFSTVAGIEGLDGARPSNWNLADNTKHIIFDSRINYLRKLSTSSLTTLTLNAHPINSAGIAVYSLGASIQSVYATSLCLGRQIGKPVYGPSAFLSSSAGVRIISFQAITDNALLTTPVLVEHWSGFQNAVTFNLEYQLLVGY